MPKIAISKHAIERYKERMNSDTLRNERSDKTIKKMITDAIIASEGWPKLEERMVCETRKEYELWIKIFDEWDLIGKGKAVISPTKNKKNYTVVTFVT